MAKYRFVVFTNPVTGREDEFNEWYDEVHLGDVLGVEGVVAAQRFRYADELGNAPPGRYLAIYEWDAPSAKEARAALDRAREAGAIPLSDALDREQTRAWFFESVTDRRTP